MLRLLFSALLLAGLCASCGPGLTFEPYAVEAPLNLEPVLGRDVVLLGPDTVHLRVRYQPETRQNLITRQPKGDTLVLAWATRYRRHYYLTSAYDDDNYFVEALRLRGRELRGLVGGSRYVQLDSLHRRLDRGQYAALVTKHERTDDDDNVRLRYHARTLHPFYRDLLDHAPAYRLVPAATYAAALAAPATPAAPPTAPAAAADSAAAPLIRQLYPNPAHDHATLTLAAPAATVELLNASGQVRRTWHPATTAATRLDLAGLPAGAYVLRASAGGRTARQRLLVQP